MAKLIRRGAIVGAAALAGSLAFGAPAVANDDPFIDGAPTIDGAPDISAENGPAIWRFADKDRVGTSIDAAERTGGWGDTVIIANSQVYADALAATPGADILDAPILLSNPGDALDPRVVDYITSSDNGVKNVVLLGGTDVFGDPVTDQIADLVGANHGLRIDGPNRYQTAIAIADWTMDHNNDNEREFNADNVFIASGTNFPDALAAGAAAANNNGVVLLTQGYDGIDSKTYAALNGTGSWDLGLNDIHGSFIAVGGPAASALQNGWQGEPVKADDEVVGVNRYETATMLASEYFTPDSSENANITIASGENFPDGVVGGAFAANVDGPLLLTKEDSLTNVTADYMTNVADRDNVENVILFGGPDSVAMSVTQEIAALPWLF